MTHSRNTAEEYYQILNKTKQVVVGHGALGRRLGSKESVETSCPDEMQDTTTAASPKKDQPPSDHNLVFIVRK